MYQCWFDFLVVFSSWIVSRVMSIFMITKDAFFLVMSLLEWNIDVKWHTFWDRLNHCFCVVNMFAFLGNFCITVGGFLNFTSHWRGFSGVRLILNIMNWNTYFMAAIWLKVLEFCWYRYQFTILPFNKFAITISSPYLQYKNSLCHSSLY